MSIFLADLRRPDVRRGRPLALTEVDIIEGVRVFIVTEGGSEPDSPWTLRAEAPPVDTWCSYLPVLKAEIEIYPARMLDKVGLKSIVLCTGLSFEGRRVGGLPDFVAKKIYLDVSGGPDSVTFDRRAIHHEIFHLIDHRDGNRLDWDPTWADLNRGAVPYGNGGIHAADPAALLPDESVEGFLNKYSRSAMAEDKAEVYSHMMACEGELARRMRKDKIIRSKYQEIIKRLTTFFPDEAPDFWFGVAIRRGL